MGIWYIYEDEGPYWSSKLLFPKKLVGVGMNTFYARIHPYNANEN